MSDEHGDSSSLGISLMGEENEPKRRPGRPAKFKPTIRQGEPGYDEYRDSLSDSQKRLLDRLQLPRIYVDKQGSKPEGYYTKAEILEKTGITETEFRSLQVRKNIRPVARCGRSWTYYNEDTLKQIVKAMSVRVLRTQRQPEDGKLAYTQVEAAEVLKMIEKGKNPSLLIIQRNMHPGIIRAVIADLGPISGGGFWLNRAQVSKISHLLELEGNELPTKSRDFVERIEKAHLSGTCQECGVTPRAILCNECFRSHDQKVKERREARKRRAAEPLPSEDKSDVSDSGVESSG